MTFSILPQSLRIDERRLVNCKKKDGLNVAEVKKVSVLLGINFLTLFNIYTTRRISLDWVFFSIQI